MSVRSGIGFSSVVALVPNLDVSTMLVARMVTPFGDGSVPGAVYSPEELIVPTTALPPVAPLTDHVNPPAVDPCIVAVNCCVSVMRTDTVAGETVAPAEIGGGTGWPGVPGGVPGGVPLPLPTAVVPLIGVLGDVPTAPAQPQAKHKSAARHRLHARCCVTVTSLRF